MKNIVIVGGGAAGWMTASLLAHFMRGGPTAITLVESEEIGIVGVGEATIPSIQEFNRALGLDEREFLRKTKASFKLGIEFVNWARLGDRYFHQFGFHGDRYNEHVDTVYLHHYLLKLWRQGDDSALEDYCSEAVAARMGRFTWPSREAPPARPPLRYAFQFDAALYAEYLRGIAEKLGVTRIEGKITSVDQRSEDGFIEAVVMENGTRVEGDFFVDCSGFRGLLIEQTLQAGFEDWSHWLPCDRAVAVPCEGLETITPYTRATAQDAGWQWRIPLQHRIGNGHVYSSSFISDDEAAATLLQNLDGRQLADPRFLRFTAGRRKKLMHKNVAAIGLASGFLEPLESTSIHLIQSGIFRLLNLLPLDHHDPATEDEYNRLGIEEYEQIRDFIILHYCATERTDTPFWNQMRTMELPDSLRHRIAVFKSRGRVARHVGQLFLEPSWVAVFLGQRIIPEEYHPLLKGVPAAGIAASMAQTRKQIRETVEKMPSHRDFLDRLVGTARPELSLATP
jgi:tryptophan halogenase